MGRMVFGIACLIFAGADTSSLPAGETALAKQAAAWEYPGAKRHSAPQGGLYLSLSTTEDELAKVVKFYEKKLGTTLELKKAGAGGVIGADDTATGSLNDSFQVGSKGRPERAISMAIATQNTKTYCVTVVISRAKGEDHTHIVVSFVSK